MPKPITLDHLRSKKKPVTTKVYIALDSEVADEFDKASDRAAMLEARHRLAKTPEDRERFEREMLDAQEEREKVREKLKANSAVFKFRSINPRKFDELAADCPPTSKQLADVEEAGGDPKELGWDPEKFAPVLIAACSLEPTITPEEAFELFSDDNWNSSELGDLFNGALNCCTQRRIVEFAIQGNGSSGARVSSTKNSATASR